MDLNPTPGAVRHGLPPPAGGHAPPIARPPAPASLTDSRAPPGSRLPQPADLPIHTPTLEASLMASVSDTYVSRILNGIEDPLFIIDPQRRVLFRNAVAQRTTDAGHGARVRAGRLVMASASETAALDQLLSECATPSSQHHCRGLRLTSTAGKAWLLLCTPIQTRGIAACFSIHMVRRLNVRQPPRAAMQDLFGLTPRELVVVERLAAGADLTQIATDIHLSRESVRVYLKRAFRKCEVHSQGELIALVQRLSVFAAGEAGDGFKRPAM